MFKLILTDGVYNLVHKRAVIPGNIYRIVIAMRHLGISYADIEAGILSMERNGTNVAEYSNNMFMRSYKE